MTVAFGKHGDVSDHNMPYSFIKRVKKKIKGIPVWFAGMAKTFWSVSGLAGVASFASVFSGPQASGRYQALSSVEAKNIVTVFFAGGAA